jgi:hypothetical protein
MLMLAYDPSTNPLNSNEWSFPLAECFHIAAFAFSIGTIAIVDFRILGLGMMHQKASKLLSDMSLYTLSGLIVVITSGLVIFTTDPLAYYNNFSFRYKMFALLAAIIFHYTVLRKVALADQTGAGAKAAAALSLLLWVSICFAGLFYAFT